MLVHSTWDVGVSEKKYGLVSRKERLDRGTVTLLEASVRDEELEGICQLCRLVEVIDDAGRKAAGMGDLGEPAIESQLLLRRQIEP